MSFRDLIGFVALPIVLLAAAYTIHQSVAWSSLGNLTAPWFCTALAIALLIAGAISLLGNRPLADIPLTGKALVFVGVQLVLGLGFAVDGLSYGQRQPDWGTTVGEWLGFGVVFGGVLLLSHRGMRRARADSGG